MTDGVRSGAPSSDTAEPRLLGWVDGAGRVGENRFDMLVAEHAVVAVDDLSGASRWQYFVSTRSDGWLRTLAHRCCLR